MQYQKFLNRKRKRRAQRTRAAIRGTAERPRLSVFRSARYTAAQLINDVNGITLLAGRTKTAQQNNKPARLLTASELGEAIARQAREKGIEKIVFDRGRYKYHGRVRALAEGLRKGGLMF